MGRTCFPGHCQLTTAGCLHSHIYASTHTGTHTRACSCNTHIHCMYTSHVHPYTCMPTHTPAHARTHTHTRPRIHKYTYTICICTHASIHTRAPQRSTQEHVHHTCIHAHAYPTQTNAHSHMRTPTRISYTCSRRYARTHAHVHLYTRVHSHAHMHAHPCTCLCTYTTRTHTRAHAHTCTPIHMHTCSHYTHQEPTCTHTHTCSNTCTCTHRYTPPLKWLIIAVLKKKIHPTMVCPAHPPSPRCGPRRHHATIGSTAAVAPRSKRIPGSAKSGTQIPSVSSVAISPGTQACGQTETASRQTQASQQAIQGAQLQRQLMGDGSGLPRRRGNCSTVPRALTRRWPHEGPHSPLPGGAITFGPHKSQAPTEPRKPSSQPQATGTALAAPGQVGLSEGSQVLMSQRASSAPATRPGSSGRPPPVPSKACNLLPSSLRTPRAGEGWPQACCPQGLQTQPSPKASPQARPTQPSVGPSLWGQLLSCCLAPRHDTSRKQGWAWGGGRRGRRHHGCGAQLPTLRSPSGGQTKWQLQHKQASHPQEPGLQRLTPGWWQPHGATPPPVQQDPWLWAVRGIPRRLSPQLPGASRQACTAHPPSPSSGPGHCQPLPPYALPTTEASKHTEIPGAPGP